MINFCQWMIYRGCNNKCNYCGVPTTVQSLDINHLRTVNKTFQLLDGKTKRLEFIGGEILDYPLLNTLIELGNKSSIERLVIITTAINESKLQEVVKLMDSQKWGFCFTLDIPERKLESNEYDKYRSELSGAIRKSEYGWKAFRKYSKSLWLRGHVTIGSHNLKDVPEIAKRVLEEGAFFNCCPILYSREGYTETSFIFRSLTVPNVALRPEDKSLVKDVVGELIELKNSFGELFLPSEEYLKLIPLFCKEPTEMYPAGCGDTMTYLRLGDRITEDKTFEVMACSDLYLGKKDKPQYGLKSWIENRSLVEEVWKNCAERQLCRDTQGCGWSVSMVLSKGNT